MAHPAGESEKGVLRLDLKASGELAHQSETLRSEVDKFLAQVRVA